MQCLPFAYCNNAENSEIPEWRTRHGLKMSKRSFRELSIDWYEQSRQCNQEQECIQQEKQERSLLSALARPNGALAITEESNPRDLKLRYFQ